MNFWIGTGRLCATPELRCTPNGKSTTNLRLAIDESYGAQRNTMFVNVVVWNKQAEVCSKFLTRGQMVTVQGRLSIRSYINKAGEKRFLTEIVASRIEFGARPKGTGFGAGYGRSNDFDPADDVNPIGMEATASDIPF